MAVGSKFVLDTLLDAQDQLTTYKENLQSGMDEDDPLPKLNHVLDAQTDHNFYRITLQKAYILNAIDPNGTYANFKTEIDALDDEAIAEAYELLTASTCNDDYTLDCLTTLFADSQNASLDITPLINVTLKERIIAEVSDIVTFTYNGRDSNDVALKVPNNQGLSWDDSSVTARTLFENVPFAYDRGAAAGKAVQLANRGQGNALDDYNFVAYGTDSARFMSVAIHAGGLPFTTTDVSGQTNICDDEIAAGWCAFPTGNQVDANRIFVLHNSANLPSPPGDVNPIDPNDLRADTGLVGYFLGSEIARGEGINSEGSDSISIVSVEQIFGLPSEYGIVINPDLIPLNQQLPSVSYTIFNNTNLESRLTTIASQLSGFEAGDYVFTAGSNPHGFLITGWGVSTR